MLRVTLVTASTHPPALTCPSSLWLAPDGSSPGPLPCPDVHSQSDKSRLGSSRTLGSTALAPATRAQPGVTTEVPVQGAEPTLVWAARWPCHLPTPALVTALLPQSLPPTPASYLFLQPRTPHGAWSRRERARLESQCKMKGAL